MAGGAHCILIPEIPYEVEHLAETILQRDRTGSRFTIVVVAEGARPVGGEVTVIGHAVGQAVQLGGVGGKVAAEISAMTGKETRTVVLGHLLRGGSPTALDRLLGLRFGQPQCGRSTRERTESWSGSNPRMSCTCPSPRPPAN